MEIMESLDLEAGVLVHREVPEFSSEYRRVHAGAVPGGGPRTLEPGHTGSLDRRFVAVAAGAAGGKVRSAARLAGIAAVLSGLWVAQRDEYPVTVKSGHSVSTLILDSRPIDFTGSNRPDLAVLLAPEGVKTALTWLAAMRPSDRVIAVPQVVGSFETAARVSVADPAGTGVSATDVSLMAITAGLVHAGIIGPAALLEAVVLAGGRHADRSRHAVEAGARLAASFG
jgi:Pyruvate/2-oxoacid:ferredoxin oxidoreductase gamma subunit